MTDRELTPEHLRGAWTCPVVAGCRVGGPRGSHTHEHNPVVFAAGLVRARQLADWGGGVVGDDGWARRMRTAWRAVNGARARSVALHMRSFHSNPGDAIRVALEQTFGVVDCPRCHKFYPGTTGRDAHMVRCRATGRPGHGVPRGAQFGRALRAARAAARAAMSLSGRPKEQITPHRTATELRGAMRLKEVRAPPRAQEETRGGGLSKLKGFREGK